MSGIDFKLFACLLESVFRYISGYLRNGDVFALK